MGATLFVYRTIFALLLTFIPFTYYIRLQQNIFATCKMHFCMNFMYAAHCSSSSTSMDGRPLSLQNIIMLLSWNRHTNAQRISIGSLIECKQFMKMHTTVFLYVNVSAPWGGIFFYPCKIDSLHDCVYSYSCSVHKHAFIRFILDKKKERKCATMFIEIQCKLNPFMRTLNLLWVWTARTNEQKKTLVILLNEWFFYSFYEQKLLAFRFHCCVYTTRANFNTFRILLQHYANDH